MCTFWTRYTAWVVACCLDLYSSRNPLQAHLKWNSLICKVISFSYIFWKVCLNYALPHPDFVSKTSFYATNIHPNYNISCKYLCISVLFCSRNYSTIKGELIPYLVKKQFKRQTSSAKQQTEDPESHHSMDIVSQANTHNGKTQSNTQII